MTIHWYPGHMAKAKNLLKETLKIIDVIIELVDARIPSSSRNPDFDILFGTKPRLMLLNKKDLADDVQTRRWLEYLNKSREKKQRAIAINTMNKEGYNEIVPALKDLAAEKLEALKAKGYRHRPIRVMVVGIPNVGKSSFINKLVGKTIAKTGDRPGVTRGQQWIRIHKDIELLDTPGLLWPKFADPEVGIKLAATGAIKEEILPIEDVVLWIIQWFLVHKPEALKERYKLTELSYDPYEILLAIGRKRGFLLAGGKVETQRTATVILDEFQKGKIAKVTFDFIF
ncbi:Ras superfamily GTP-binding protein YlqF [Carboxydocella sporoproducens DSM 16521]|uniref:Ribosome biogenesis GTPase A n=2 Tax=Carboxydocella TaxID=178898 RepID=A0A1T4PXX2_9FIRM|nr:MULTISPECIES: ribosome biogenesis GTPase YlqF [Carboxydocella]AVX20491.1 Ras superfamily GTP-binding protein YlqF [Carboxydocella thermautotrophica]SJZ96339.1 Ras superfamily GTP-binding protein YlqF [Carboxydocella sporoproducens DSM 16521]